jgi:hypothetical protein
LGERLDKTDQVLVEELAEVVEQFQKIILASRGVTLLSGDRFEVIAKTLLQENLTIKLGRLALASLASLTKQAPTKSMII